MLTCKDATRMIASEEFAEAGWRKRLGVRLHLAMCRHCRRYAVQMQAIGACARKLWGPEAREDSATVQRLERSILKRPSEPPQETP